MIIPSEVNGYRVTPRGVHLHPNGLHNHWMENAGYWLDLLVDMGMSWVVALSESDNLYLSGAAEALLGAGIIPIVRFNYQFPSPWTFGDQVAQLADLYAKHGAPLVVQFANEPFDSREWRDGEVPSYEDAWSIIVERWHQAAGIIIERGGYAGFPDGPCYAENPFERIGDEALHWQEGKAVYLCHSYGVGRPLNYPEEVAHYGYPLSMEDYRFAIDDFADDPQWNEGEAVLALMNEQRGAWADPTLTTITDDTCWRGWEKVMWWAVRTFGHEVQTAVTEGGWTPRDRAGSNPVDIRWPYTTPKMVATKTLAMYNDPSPHFAICPWLLADGDMAGGDVGWPFEAWCGWAYSELYGREKPVIQLLRENPPETGDGLDRLEELLEAIGRLGDDVGHLLDQALAALPG